MKIAVLVFSVLLLGSLPLVQRVYAIPAEVKQQVKVVDYEHESRFDYVAHLKPSYLYEDYRAPQAIPQIPVSFIDGCSMTYTFKSAEQISREVRVEAILENAQLWRKTVILVPETNRTGDFSLDFPVDLGYFQTLAQTIDAEIGIFASAYNVSVKVIISQPQAASGQIGQDFTQVFPIKLGKSFVEMGSELTHRQADSLGIFDYTVQLKPNSLFDDAALKPPPILASDKTLQTGDPVLLRLLDVMDMSFSYYLKSNKPVKQSIETVEIDAIIEVPDQWSKAIVIIPPTQESGDFTVTFPMVPGQFAEIAGLIQQEAGLTPARYNLGITARVSVAAGTDFGTITKNFIHEIKTTLNEGILNWGETLEQSIPGSITVTETFKNQQKYLWLPLATARIIFPIVAGVLFIVLIFFLVLYFSRRPQKLTEIDREAQRVGKKYKAIIAEVKDLPKAELDETVIFLNSLDDLIKTAEGLFKPVLHKAEKDKHTYLVFDGLVIYKFVSQLELSDTSSEKLNRETESKDTLTNIRKRLANRQKPNSHSDS